MVHIYNMKSDMYEMLVSTEREKEGKREGGREGEERERRRETEREEGEEGEIGIGQAILAISRVSQPVQA